VRWNAFFFCLFFRFCSLIRRDHPDFFSFDLSIRDRQWFPEFRRESPFVWEFFFFSRFWPHAARIVPRYGFFTHVCNERHHGIRLSRAQTLCHVSPPSFEPLRFSASWALVALGMRVLPCPCTFVSLALSILRRTNRSDDLFSFPDLRVGVSRLEALVSDAPLAFLGFFLIHLLLFFRSSLAMLSTVFLTNASVRFRAAAFAVLRFPISLFDPPPSFSGSFLLRNLLNAFPFFAR